MNIKHSSCCDLVEQKVNFWFTNSGELVIESELLSRLYDNFEPTSVKSRVVMNEDEVETLPMNIHLIMDMKQGTMKVGKAVLSGQMKEVVINE